MVDALPLVVIGRNSVNDPVEIAADPATGTPRNALWVKMLAEDNVGDLVPFTVAAGGGISTTPAPTVVIHDIADITLATAASVLIGPYDVLTYKSIAGHLIANQALTYTLKYGRLSTLLTNKTTLEPVTATANEPVEFRDSRFLGQFFGILIANASGSTATISGQILGFPA